MNSKTIILIATLLACTNAVAQNVDEALKAFSQKANAANANVFFDALYKENFIDERVHFDSNSPKDSLEQQVWFWAAEWMYDLQEYKQAEMYALKALPLYHPSNHDMAGCLNTLGCINVRMSDFKQAALYARKSVEIELKHGNHDLISSSLNTLAGIYMAGHQAKDAEKIILQAINHANQVDNPSRKAIILGMASEIYHTLGNDEEALSYAEQAIELEKSLNRPKKLVVRLSQKASALLGLHRYKEAEVICRQISPQLKENGDYHSYAITLNRLGMSLLCQERQQEAIPYYKEAAYLFSKMGDLYNEIHSQRGLYESYWTLNSDSAKQYLDTFELLKDSLYTRSTAEALSRYNAEFGNKQLQIENAKIRKTQHLIIVFAVVIILLFSIATWLIIQHSRKQMQDLVKKIERMKAISDASTREDSASQATTAEKEDSDEDMFLMHVIETVNTAMSNGNFGVEQIASELNISTQTFRRRLQNATGETPKAYIQAIQMERAITLLKQNQELSISQIAQQCGFNDVSSFSHTFRRIYGCSPTRYREKQ